MVTISIEMYDIPDDPEIRVLFVDDVPEILGISKDTLQTVSNCCITTALGMEKALDLMSANTYDVIVSDYQMEGGTGIEFLTQVRQKYGPIPFILFTGKGREEVVIEALNAGADFYLQKGGDTTATFRELSSKIKQASDKLRAIVALSESRKRLIRSEEDLQSHHVELITQTEELRRSNALLEESNDKFVNLYEFAPIGYFSINENGQIVEVNLTGSIMLNEKRFKLIKMKFNQFIVEDDMTVWRSFVKEVSKHGGKQSCSITIRREGGSTFSAFIETTQFTTSTFGIAISDISQFAQMEHALRRSSKKIALLTSITRHDINNQLMVIQDFGELLENSPHAKEIITAARRIQAMIQFTKEYESIGCNAPFWQDITTAINNAIKDVPSGSIIVKNLVDKDLAIFTDALMTKVFYNLLDNAVRYGDTVTTITISNVSQGNNVIIIVEDNGCGIAPSEKKKIFDRGYGKNGGLGLFLSREILDITGIIIQENGEHGKGARFELTILPESYMHRVKI